MTKFSNLLSKTVKRLDREISGPLNNFSEQFRYGHREVLVMYAGVSPFLAIKGSIEHGWSPFGPSVGIPRFFGGRYLNLAWSSSSMEGKSLPKSVVAVGAPFLYLCEAIKEGMSKTDVIQKRKYLYLPPHGSEDATPLVKSQLKAIQYLVNPREVTIQLYWTEFLNNRVRRSYEELGFTVETAGFCGMSSIEGLGISARERAISDIGGRHLFLLHILSNLMSHDHIFAGHFSTSTLYAGYLEKSITLMDDWHSHATTHKFSKNPLITKSPPYWDYYQHIIDEVIPRYFNDGEAKGIFKDYCKKELGYSDLLNKKDLSELLEANAVEVANSFTVLDLERAVRTFPNF